MNKIIASATLVALGAASVNAAYAPGPSTVQTIKPWSVSASLRGFYDDNYTTAPDNAAKSSFGMEVRPSVSYSMFLDATSIKANYTYGAKWYEDSDKWDQTHQVSASLDHNFSENCKVDLSDSFVSAQEPEVLQSGPVVYPLRSKGDNFRNTGTIGFDSKVTRLFGIRVGYSNTIYDFQENAGDVANSPLYKGLPPNQRPLSRSAVLDRMEHLANIDLRWQALPQTVALVGYQYGQVDYSSSEIIGKDASGNPLNSSYRNNRSHYIYAGIDQNFNQKLNGSLRVGAQLTEYENASSSTKASPYVDGSLDYTYAPGSYVQVGLRHARNQTDATYDFALAGAGVSPALDAESTTAYASVHHKITAKLTGTLFGQFQYSEFRGGNINGFNDKLYLIGLNLDYQLNPYVALETGYNYDKLDSEISNRTFSRNQVFAGLRATF